MAKRNQVTTDLRISADAQLKNSRSFLNQLDKMIDKFDFGDRINNQLLNAKNQLRDYNKILEKIQSKSLVSEEELKDITKAGKEIANIVAKTEKLYSNLSANDLQKFSKEYINKIKAQEEAVAKIKDDYAARTGKNFDKELANYDKLSAKVRALEQQKANLAKNGATDIATREIEQLNQKLEEQKNKLLEIRKIQQTSTNAYSSTLEAESKKRGYNNYSEIKNVKIQSEDQIRKQLGNNEYKQQANLISQINREIREIEKNKQDINLADKSAVNLANKYKIENVSTLNSLKEQVRLKKENLNNYKKDKSSLADEKLVTVELERQNRILEDRNAIEKAAKSVELNVIQQGGYNSKASLAASASATNRSIDNLENQLTESGIENITNNAAQMVAAQIAKLNTEISKGNQDLAGIDETNKKLATQSERAADENDIKDMSSNVNRGLLDTKEKINNHTTEDNTRISSNILNALTPNASSVDFKTIVHDNFSDVDYNTDEMGETYDKFFDKFNNDFKKLAIGEISSDQMIKTIENNKQTIQTILIAARENLIEEINNTKKELNDLATQEEKGLLTNREGKDITSLSSTVDERLIQLQKMNNVIDGVNKDFDIATKKVNSFNNTTMKSHIEMTQKGADNLSRAAEQSRYLGSTFDEIGNKIGYFLSMNYVFDQMVRKIREASEFTKNLDKDMVQIGLVLGQTSGQTWKNFDTYAQMADRLNTTVSDVAGAMKLFYQQGLNTAEVNKMVEASAIAAALGESSMAEASETLTSIINSYNLSANQALDVTDKISMVAMVSAADFGELSTAIEKVASSAASAGLDLDHMMGYLAKMIETTREAPTNIGTALKTIVANFTQFKEDPTGLAEEGTAINKVDTALKSVGISLTDTTGEVRDLSEIIDDLGKKWNSLTRNQKSYLATQIAGTRQQSRFYALMNDYNRTLELVEESTESDGKATEQFALYQDSLTASTAKLQNEWEKFYNSITKNDTLLKGFNGTLSSILKVANKLGPVFTTVLGAGLLKVTRVAISHLSNVKRTIEEINKEASSIGQIMQNNLAGQDTFKNYSFTRKQNKLPLGKASNSFGNEIANTIFNRKGGQQQLIDAQVYTDLADAISNVNDKNLELLSTNKDVLVSLIGEAETTQVLKGSISAETKAKILDTAQTKVSAAEHTVLTSIKWGEVAAQLALNLAVAAGVIAVTYFINKIVKAANAEHEAAVAAQEHAKQAQEEQKSLTELSEKYQQLHSKIILTNEEREELADTISNLADQFPDLVEGIDAEGNAYLVANSKLEEYLKNKKLEAALDKEDAANKLLNDKKTKDSAYTDKSWAAGASQNKDNFLSSSLQNSSQALQSAVDDIKNYQTKNIAVVKGVSGVLTQDAINPFKDIAHKIEENLAKGDTNAVRNLIRQQQAQNYDNYSESEKETMRQQWTTLDRRLAEYEKTIRSSYADVAKNKYSGDIVRFGQENNFNTEQFNVAENLLQNYFKEQMKNYSSGPAMKNAIKNGDLKDGLDEILENVSLLTNEEIEDYNQLISDYKTGELSLTELKDNLNKYNDSIKELAIKYIEEAEEEINKMAEVDLDKYNKVNTGRGNIDLNKRPQYKNEDGSISTIDAVSFNIDGMEVLLPSVWENEDGTVVHADSNTEEGKKAILNRYVQTGEYLGKFETALEADTYALELHEQQTQQYNERNNEEEIEQRRKENLSKIDSNTRRLLANTKDKFQGGADFTDEQFNLAYGKALENADFLTDLQNLDTTSALDIKAFKEKYSDALGKYGEKFIAELVKQPEYDAEKVAEKLSGALSNAAGEGTTKSGASMSDIAAGTSDTGGANILSSNDETRTQNLLLIGQKVKVSAEEISDSYRQAYKDVMENTSQIISQAEDKINDHITTIKETLKDENWNVGDNIDYSKLTKSEQELVKNSEKAIGNLKKQVQYATELQKRYESLSIGQKANIDYGNFRNGTIAANEMINSLTNLASIYDVVINKEYTQLDLINWIANDTSGQLLAALEVENGQLYLNANAMEVLAEAQKQEALQAIDAEITKTEAQIAYVEAHGATSQQVLDDLDAINTGESQLSSNTSSYMSSMMNNFTQWASNVKTNGSTIGGIINGLITAYNQLHKAEADGTGTAVTVADAGVLGATSTGNTGANGGIDDVVTLSTLQDKLAKLKALREGLSKMSGKDLLNGINKMGSYGGGSDKGSKDKFDSILEKLDHFYNYLRKIEKIESRLNKLAEKRNLIDANNNYYIDDLKEENDLLLEQQKLYTSYISDEGEYLAELREQLKNSAYGDKVFFDDDGLIQVKQTEFSADSEEEQEKLEAFMELINEYQDEYNTKLENENKLIQIQVQQLENVKKMYDKVLQRISDVTEEIERQIGLTEHKANMDFSEINQVGYLGTEANQNVSGLEYSLEQIGNIEKEIKKVNKAAKNLPYAELLEWDEALQQWNVNESKMNDPAVQKKYEKLGYSWNDIETKARSIVTSSQSLNKNLKETVEKSNNFRENLKQILDNLISGIGEFFSNSTSAINNYFGQIERAMTKIDNENDMFGVDSESLEDKYKTLVQSTVLLKQLVASLEKQRKKTEKELTESYGSFVTFIDGVAVMNEQAVNNSKKLTTEQKADLKLLIAAYNNATDQIEEMEDKQVEYFQKMLEMEKAKQEAIINLKQQVHDQLMAQDQEEIDNLRSKYDKMNQLDNEYYSELQRRVSDARDMRDRRQESQNIGQMQAKLAVLKADNSGDYNAELIELQKQLNEALQTQADNEVNRELERIQREQQEREKDRQLTISAMENVLTFKDENNWYWQETDRLWEEGQKSVEGILMQQLGDLNISAEERATQAETLENQMETAFSTTVGPEGTTTTLLAGTVSGVKDAVDKTDLTNQGIKSSLGFLNDKFGKSGVTWQQLDTSNTKTASIDTKVSNLPNNFKTKMQDLYNKTIKTDATSGAAAVKNYLGEGSTLVKKTQSIIDKITTGNDILTNKKSILNEGISSGFTTLHDALIGKTDSVISNVSSYLNKYLGTDSELFKYLNPNQKNTTEKKDPQTPKPQVTEPKPSTNTNSTNNNNNNSSSGANAKPDLKIGASVSVKPGTRWYYDSYGTNPSGIARGGVIRYTNLKGSHPYNIEGLGWIRKQDIVGYSKGGYVDYTGIANVHGTASDPEAFLNAKQTRLFEGLRDSLVRSSSNKTYSKEDKPVTKEEYNIDNVSIEVKQIADVDAIDKVTKRVKEEIYKDATSNKNNMAIRRR